MAQVPRQFDSDLPADKPVLEFDSVTLGITWPYDTQLESVSFSIRPGELMLVTLAPGHVRSPIADLTQRLIDPHKGTVRICGRDWESLSPREMAASRSRVGRVFDVGGWVSNLDVDENVMLAQRHHETAPADELYRRADELARLFTLDGVPTRRPAETSQNDLRLSQWVRAFLGDMNVLVLERPTRDVQPAAIGAFVDCLQAARRKGAGVLWITTDGASPTSITNLAPPDITYRYAVRDNGLRLESSASK